MLSHHTWYEYAADVRASIDRLPHNSRIDERRCQILLSSHITAITEHSYPGTFKEWESLIEVFGWQVSSNVKPLTRAHAPA